MAAAGFGLPYVFGHLSMPTLVTVRPLHWLRYVRYTGHDVSVTLVTVRPLRKGPGHVTHWLTVRPLGEVRRRYGPLANPPCEGGRCKERV